MQGACRPRESRRVAAGSTIGIKRLTFLAFERPAATVRSLEGVACQDTNLPRLAAVGRRDVLGFPTQKGGGPWIAKISSRTPAFEPMSKRRKGFPSETHVKRGVRIVHGDKELAEKLGRNDLCPCGSGKRFKKCCLDSGCFRRCQPGPLLSGSDGRVRFTL